jgi:protoporphyrinogen oxidase
MARTAIIIGAGPAGLTAAYELLTRTDVLPIVLERTDQMGGISRTVNYKGNRIDIGGHRFFSKSDRVVKWWLDRLALEQNDGSKLRLTYQNQSRELDSHGDLDAESTDRVMLIRSRKSRIYFRRRFFDYPLSLSVDTLSKLGLFQTMLIGFSYCRSALFPIKPEENLEQFFINRFGRRLYQTFFKSYTEKVWGVPCNEISAEWGAQRVKGLSILKALTHMAKQALPKKKDLSQKDVETSLIEWFMYPKFGPGQVWEETAELVTKLGGQILTNWKVQGIQHSGNRITSVEAVHATSGEKRSFQGDFFFSTMPVKDLVHSLNPPAPAPVREVAQGLMYRDFITVGLLCKSLKLSDAPVNANGSGKHRIKDNWIYIQEPDALVGRLQIFNNWSPYMVANPDHTWIGLEYFCNEGDELWRKSDDEMKALAKQEMQRLQIVDPSQVLDSTVIRMEKTYPAYFGSYDRFGEIRQYLDAIGNLFLVGRNGMHKYNNQDHSMLTAMVAVDNIASGITGKDNLWSVNTEQEYHEQK